MNMPAVGDAAPPFDLESHRGDRVKLEGLRGHPVVVYFYPKDNTPGCSLEAQEFQAHLPEFEQLGAVVVGISPDALKSHCKFAEKFGLNFRLLLDEDHRMAEAYGAWGEKSLYGKKFLGIIRSTFLIGPDGKVARVWPKVKAAGHAAEVLQVVRELLAK